MPRTRRQRNITGRSRRDNIREAMQNSRKEDPNAELDQLVANFNDRIALTNPQIPQHSLGDMTLPCQKCGALHFHQERGGRDEGFSSCCHKGKVGLHVPSGKDMCDCFSHNCPGCFMPCPKCRSTKCGVDCRVNRKWSYDMYHIEGLDLRRVNKLQEFEKARNDMEQY